MKISVFLGKIHWASILLHIFIKGEIMKGLLIFMIFVEISYPLEFLLIKESIILFLLRRCNTTYIFKWLIKVLQ